MAHARPNHPQIVDPSYLGMSIDQGLTDAELLAKAISAIKVCDSSMTASVLEARVNDSAEAEEDLAILDSEQAAEVIDKSDAKDVSEYVVGARTHQQHLREVKETILKIRGSARKVGSRSKEARKAVQFHVPVSGWTAEAASMMALPTCRFQKDLFIGRWRCWYGSSAPKCTRSKSWGLGDSDESCLRDLLRAAWIHHESLIGEKCAVEGL